MFFFFFNTEESVLRLEYTTKNAIIAEDISKILNHLAKGFNRYLRSSGQKSALRLAVQRIEIGSLIVDLVVVGTAATLSAVENKEAIFGFVGFLDNIISIARGIKSGKNTEADRRLLHVIQKPIAEGNAQQLNIFVVGNGNVLNIDKHAVQNIKEANHLEKYMSQTDREIKKTTSPLDANKSKNTRSKIINHNGMEETFGTTINVKGQWYVRLEGKEGVLNPLKFKNEKSLKDGQIYNFDGTLQGSTCYASDASPI